MPIAKKKHATASRRPRATIKSPSKGELVKAIRTAISSSVALAGPTPENGQWMHGGKPGKYVPIPHPYFDGFELACAQDRAHVTAKYESRWITVRRISTRRAIWRQVSVSLLTPPMGLVAKLLKLGGPAALEAAQIAELKRVDDLLKRR